MVRGGIVDKNLTIYNVTLNDAGSYNCSATTHDGKTGTDGVQILVYSKLFSILIAYTFSVGS